MFILKLKDRDIELKWGYWAMKRLCAKLGIKATDYFGLLADGNGILDYVSEVLFVAAEYATLKRKEEVTFTDIDVCEWIDDAGGIKADGQVLEFFKYVIQTHVTNISEDKDAESEKKN